LNGHALPQCPVKHRVAGGIGKICKYNCVLFAESHWPVPKELEYSGSSGKQQDPSYGDPSPGFRFRDLYLNLRMVRRDNADFVVRR